MYNKYFLCSIFYIDGEKFVKKKFPNQLAVFKEIVCFKNKFIMVIRTFLRTKHLIESQHILAHFVLSESDYLILAN